MMVWTMTHPEADPEMLGYLPSFLQAEDPRPAREQLAERYLGGWHPMGGFEFKGSDLCYPGDPPLPCLAMATLRHEVIRFYPHAWVAIVQPDGSFEVSRVD